MKSDKDHIKDIFSSKLNGFEPELPHSLWERIDADLSSQQIVQVPVKKRNLYRYIGWVASAAAAVLLILVLYPKASNTGNGMLAMQEKKGSLPLLNRVGVHSLVNDIQGIDNKEKLLAGSCKTPVTIDDHINGTTGTKLPVSLESLQKNEEVKTVEILEPVINEEVYIAEETSQPVPVLDSKSVNDLEKDLAEKIAAFESDGRKGEDLLVYNTPDNNKSKTSSSSSSGLELGLGGSSGFSKANAVQTQLRQSALYDLVSADNQVTSGFKQQSIKLEHNQPISFGIAVNKKLNNRLSLESGVIYTYLSSKAKSVSDADYNSRDSQYFHYLGIPLSLNYKLVEWKKLQVYLSAGGVIQKDIQGRMNTYQSVEGLENTKEVIRKNISQDHPQYSLTGSLGLSYPVYKKISVYTNLGGAYYFDAKNDYETIYSDRKWIFNLNAGFKFGF